MAKAAKSAILAAAIVGIITVATGGAGGLAAPAIFGLTQGSAGAAIAFAATMAFVSTGISMMTAKKLPSGLGDNFGTKVSTKNPTAPRQIVYGQCRVGGTFTQIETSGTDNSVLHIFTVLAGHPIDSLQKVFINDKALALGSETSSSSINGETVHTVTANFFENSDNPNNLGSGALIRFTFHDGTQTAVDGFAQAQLNTTSVPNTHIFKNCPYVYMQMVYDSEKLPNVPNISFEVKGKKLFDPRTSQTAFTDSTGKVIGNNPALVLRDILTDTSYGVGVTSSEINDTTNAGGFAAAANTCEQSVTLADGSTTEQRYECNGFTNFAATREDIIAGITSSMAGTMTYSNGKFNAFAGANQTASLTITDDDCLSPIAVTTKSMQGDLYNTVKTMFSDENQKFIPTDTPILQNSTFLSADTPSGETSANFVKTMEVRLPFTTSNTMAQRLGKIALLHQRETTTIRVTTTLKFLQLQPADYVQITNERLSFSNKLFEVMAVNMVLEGDDNPFIACQLDLKEISTSVYDFATNEYSTIQAEGSDLTSGALTVTAPTAGSINQTATIDGTTTKVNIKVVWSNASNEAIQGTEVQYKLSSDSTYTSQISGKGQTIAVIPNVTVGQTYNVRVRHFTFDNVYSSATDFSNITITQPTAAPNSPSSASVTTGNAFGIRVQWTNPSNSDLRAVKIYRKTNSTTPTNDTNLVQTVYGEPSAVSKADFGIQDGLSFNQTYYFWVRAINHGGTHSSGFVSAGNATFQKVDTGELEDSAVNDNILGNNISIGSHAANGSLGGSVGAVATANNTTEFNFSLLFFFSTLTSDPHKALVSGSTFTLDPIINQSFSTPVHQGGNSKDYMVIATCGVVGTFGSTSDVIMVLSASNSSDAASTPFAHSGLVQEAGADAKVLGPTITRVLKVTLSSNSTVHLRVHGGQNNITDNASSQKGLGNVSLHVIGLSA